MGIGLKSQTIEALRLTLQQLEQAPSPEYDPDSVAELKRILVNRIAELELALALEGSQRETPSPADALSPLAAIPATPTEEVSLDGSPTLPKLD